MSIGDDFYAIESTSVVEIIPRVPLRKVHHVPEYVAGLFQYRGAIVPVIDLCHLIRGTSSSFCLSTRIIMVSYQPQEKTRQYLGLVAEKITETVNKTQTEFVDSGIRVKEAPYLGGILMHEKGIIQHIRLDKLFTDVQNTYLLTAGEI